MSRTTNPSTHPSPRLCSTGQLSLLALSTQCLEALTRLGVLPRRKLEVRWKYYSTEDPKEPVYIWCWGTVVKVADGVTDKTSDRASNVLEYGAVRIKWPEDSEYGEKETYSWLLLRKNKWNKNVHYGWRYVHPDRTRLP